MISYFPRLRNYFDPSAVNHSELDDVTISSEEEESEDGDMDEKTKHGKRIRGIHPKIKLQVL